MNEYWIERLLYLRGGSIVVMIIASFLIVLYFFIWIASLIDMEFKIPKQIRRYRLLAIIFFLLAYFTFLFIPSEKEFKISKEIIEEANE